MIAIHAQTERKRLDRSVRCAEKRRPWARKQRLRGLIRPDPAVCATAGAACGRKSLSSARIQAIFTSNDTPLGECRSDYLRSRPGGEDAYQRIEAEIKLAQRDYAGAEAARQKIKAITVQDRLLKARILEAQGQDNQTPFDQREALLNESAALRATNKSVDEYDFD